MLGVGRVFEVGLIVGAVVLHRGSNEFGVHVIWLADVLVANGDFVVIGDFVIIGGLVVL